jgi:hypothetical protein
MHLQLSISTDPFGDSLLAATSSCEPEIATPPANRLHLQFGSRQWLKEGQTLQETLDALAQEIMAQLQNRPIEQVDILLFLGLDQPEAVTKITSVYGLLERFLRVLTTRRLVAALPHTLPELRQARENFQNLIQALATTQQGLRELQVLILPESNPGQPLRWLAQQVVPHEVVNQVSPCRLALDSLLVLCHPPSRAASYSACIFVRAAWQNYWCIRTTVDLTTSQSIKHDEPLDQAAALFAQRHNLARSQYEIKFGPMPQLGPPAVVEQFAAEVGTRPADQALDQFTLELMRVQIIRTTAGESRLRTICSDYDQELTRLLELSPGLLEGFWQALYFHNQVCALHSRYITTPGEFWKHFGREVLANLNHTLECANLFSPGLGLTPVVAEDLDEVLYAKIKQDTAILQKASWPSDWSAAHKAVLACLRLAGQILGNWSSVCNEKSAFLEQTRAVAEAADQFLCAQRQALDERLKSIREEAPVPDQFLARLRFALTQKGRVNRLIQDEKRKAQTAYATWRYQADSFLKLAGGWLCLLTKLEAVAAGLQEEQKALAETGAYLVAARDRFHRAHIAAQAEWDAVPDKLPDTPTEISFLGKAEMEALYQQFGPAKVERYLRHLRELSDPGPGWSMKWALAVYVERIVAYAERTCASVEIDLPILMMGHFPELVPNRLKQVVEISAQGLIPLTPENLTERRLHMAWGFAQDCLGQIKPACEAQIYRNDQVSLLPANLTFYPNFSRDRLDLTLSVCGFRFEDYLYWDAFQKALPASPARP